MRFLHLQFEQHSLGKTELHHMILLNLNIG